MKESTKEWLGIKPADFMIYAAFILLLPVYFFSEWALDVVLSLLGLGLCLTSCWLGMQPHAELDKVTNFLKLVTYPGCTVFFMYLVYLNFSVGALHR